ncbi:hypothetical protein BHAOGJBA_4415 [Methylobacterium hispanicum]|uniref:Uncharacterized protein n=1 Tax=Methylobacterium hispanicum TaxID=270350 RepID=A0AAV4ZRP4_9HYPH|nr:hypothetical protein [Methylobacterium hispanicum]GJD90872.1 hypothetical protein BHAOGJBA_4415 [Methylobacterium hispanicum]
MPAYLVADENTALWPHIFHDQRERMTRFVYDMDQKRLLAVQIQTGPVAGWRDAETHEFDDVAEDVSCNEPFKDPDGWDLVVVDALPLWAESIVAARAEAAGVSPGP